MAARIIANEKQSDRNKIDRSGVVSKYVGETEKRLNKIFLKAWPNNLTLFLDGANVRPSPSEVISYGRRRP